MDRIRCARGVWGPRPARCVGAVPSGASRGGSRDVLSDDRPGRRGRHPDPRERGGPPVVPDRRGLGARLSDADVLLDAASRPPPGPADRTDRPPRTSAERGDPVRAELVPRGGHRAAEDPGLHPRRSGHDHRDAHPAALDPAARVRARGGLERRAVRRARGVGRDAPSAGLDRAARAPARIRTRDHLPLVLLASEDRARGPRLSLVRGRRVRRGPHPAGPGTRYRLRARPLALGGVRRGVVVRRERGRARAAAGVRIEPRRGSRGRVPRDDPARDCIERRAAVPVRRVGRGGARGAGRF